MPIENVIITVDVYHVEKYFNNKSLYLQSFLIVVHQIHLSLDDIELDYS